MLTTACFFARSLVSFVSDAGDVGDAGDAGVWLRLRRAKALLMKDREQYFSSVRPTSVEIKGEPGSRLFWNPAFQVRLRHFELPFRAGAEKFAYDQLSKDQQVSDLTFNGKIAGSGECSIEAINRNPVTTQPVELKDRLLVQGWAAFSAQRGIASDEVFVMLTSDDDSLVRAFPARIFPRPDVNATSSILKWVRLVFRCASIQPL